MSDDNANDYLKPFLEKRGIPKDKVLDVDTAMEIKNDLLKKLKERILARAKIINERLKKQQEALKKQ